LQHPTILDLAAEDAAAVHLLDSRDDAPVVAALINAPLLQAIRDEPDIHIEADESGLVVRFRIDGVPSRGAGISPSPWPPLLVTVAGIKRHGLDTRKRCRTTAG
jgi:type II secretory ATPase GspE/PulE/Tfp pilus assembly ATPase PilB-like protein